MPEPQAEARGFINNANYLRILIPEFRTPTTAKNVFGNNIAEIFCRREIKITPGFSLGINVIRSWALALVA